MEGEENILWNTPINWFAKSSGTTSDKSKFIPISEESLKETHFKASKDVITNYYNNFPDSDLLTGKSLVVGGSHQLHQVNEMYNMAILVPCLCRTHHFGDTGYALLNYALHYWMNGKIKLTSLHETTMHENVTSIAGVPTWTIVLIKRILDISGKSNYKRSVAKS